MFKRHASVLFKMLMYEGILWCQRQVSRAGVSNYVPQYSVGCNYLAMPKAPASGTNVLIYKDVGARSRCPGHCQVGVNVMNTASLFSLKIKNDHDANFVFTNGCHINDIPSHQWRHSLHHGNSIFSVLLNVIFLAYFSRSVSYSKHKQTSHCLK